MLRQKSIATVLSVGMMLTMVGCSNTSSNSSLFKAGTYTGTGEGRNGDITVSVKLSDSAIESVVITEHKETEGVSDPAIAQIPESIVEKQTTNVDAIAGATLTSEGIKEAVNNALTSAGIDPSKLTGVEASAVKGEDLEVSADVVIVGAGGAGMAAAASASANGASVIVLEKMSAVGGNTTLGEGTYDVADPTLQATVEMTEDNKKEVEEGLAIDTTGNEALASLVADTKADYDAYLASGSTGLFDSANWHALQTYTGGGNIGDIELIRTMTTGAVDTFTWLQEEIGVPFKSDYVFMPIGGKWTRGHQVDLVAATGAESDNGGRIYIQKLKEYAEERGAKIYTDADVTELLKDDSGAIVGAKATQKDGSTITVNAKSTIITTGGYAANSELVYEYSNGTITTQLTSCAKSSTGDGIILAEEVGGESVDLDQIQVHPLGDPIDNCGCVSEFVGNWLSATEYVFVNKEGKRFVKEDGTRYEMSMAELQQTDGEMYLIVDSSEIEGDSSRDALIQSLLDDGHTVKADTIEELAKLINVDPEALKTTIETYNAGMVSGTDEFGKATSEKSVIATAPFYASLRTPTVHHTMGGIEINTSTQVLDTNGNVISGLYAAGETTGAIHGNNRLGGNAYPDIMTMGKLAGEAAAAASK